MALALPWVAHLLLFWKITKEEDGSVIIPEILRPYMRGLDRISPVA
jgi:seryl-tRNA synthetase